MEDKRYLFIKYLVENGGNWYQSCIKAGYSEAVACNPIKIRNSKWFHSTLQKMNVSADSIADVLNDSIENSQSTRTKLQYIKVALKLLERV